MHYLLVPIALAGSARRPILRHTMLAGIQNLPCATSYVLIQAFLCRLRQRLGWKYVASADAASPLDALEARGWRF
jgi:hypothetical protein